MKKAILLVSFGTSYTDAARQSLDCICQDLREAGGNIPVYQAYTSGMIIEKLSGQGIKVNTVDEAIRAILGRHITDLYVIPSHMIPGMEYQKMVRAVEKYRPAFHELRIASTVLHEKKDCAEMVSLLCEMLQFQHGYTYILMGHGTEDEANIRYHQMNEALVESGIANVHIASVEARPDLEDAIQVMAGQNFAKKIILHPFMVVAGDHARNDMAGEKDSYVSKLKQEGYQVETIVRGLGEYASFRKIYVNKLRSLLGLNSPCNLTDK